MASGHVNRANRPNTWAHRPMLHNVKNVLANSEPSTQGGNNRGLDDPVPMEVVMKFLRPRIAIGASTALAAVSITAIVTWTVHAQSIEKGPAAMSPMDHMMHDHSHAMPNHQDMRGTATPAPEKSDDARELVSLPGPMREHMLGNMRDHLTTLNTVIGDVADNQFDAASKLLEERLGMSSLKLHHAAEMAPYFPQPMQDAGTNMHHAASRLAIVLQDASVAETFDSMRKVNAALHDVTSACVACHAAYRLR
jgi:cytochrome c556